MITLNIEPRDVRADVADIRKQGKIPAVFYGKKDASTAITVSKVEFDKAFKQAGESTVVVLTGIGEEKESLIHDLDLDPTTDIIRHIDFYILEKGKKVRVSVPLEFVGVSVAIKDMGGVLIKVLHEVEIEALPKDLPHSIHADISKIVDFHTPLHAKDLVLPSGVTLVTGDEEIVAAANEAKEEVEEVAPATIADIEVQKKGKEAKEGGEEGEADAEAK